MNIVWEVGEPINIWHVSWICLHNWCRNLNWIIIASLWRFHPLSLSYFSVSFVSQSLWCFSQDQICLLHSNTCNTHTQLHMLRWVPADNQCDLGVWLTHGTDELTGLHIAFLASVLWLTAVPSLCLLFSHTPTLWERRPSQTSRCSPVSCSADTVCVWCWCQTRSQMIRNVLDCRWEWACMCAYQREKEMEVYFSGSTVMMGEILKLNCIYHIISPPKIYLCTCIHALSYYMIWLSSQRIKST